MLLMLLLPLLGNATTMEKSNFLKEIEMMKSVSKVDNQLSNFVVKMLGCTISREPMILVLEFMEYGNLLDYLRVTRNKVKSLGGTLIILLQHLDSPGIR